MSQPLNRLVVSNASCHQECSTYGEEESLPLTNVMTHLNNKYPLLGLLQYLPTLKAHGIVYAESVGGFEKGFYVGLGMTEGAVGPFLMGVKKALKLKKKE